MSVRGRKSCACWMGRVTIVEKERLRVLQRPHPADDLFTVVLVRAEELGVQVVVSCNDEMSVGDGAVDSVLNPLKESILVTNQTPLRLPVHRYKDNRKGNMW